MISASPTKVGSVRGGAIRVVLLILIGLAIVPSILPFTEETSEQDRVCIAIRDGWHADRRKPRDEDVVEVVRALMSPIPENLGTDSVARAAWLAEQERITSTPGYRRAEAYMEWRTGPGACVPEGRHRLLLSASAILAIAAVAGATNVIRRRQ